MKALALFPLFLAVLSCIAAEPAKPQPNVLLIIVDDLNAFAGHTDMAPEPVTPHLDKFAKSGLIFANAQCAAPVCNPSRTALFSGLRPSTSGIYDNDQDSMPKDHVLRRTTSLPNYFRDQGYTTIGGGKLFGSAFGSVLKHHIWDEDLNESRKGRTEDPKPPKDKIPLKGIGGKHDWGGFPDSREEMGDWTLAGRAAEVLSKPQPKPFFLGCGIVKPHTPWYVPQPYFDLFPPDKITLPDLLPDESVGLPAIARIKPKQKKQEATAVARRKEMVAAYLACARYADDCVGRVLDGLMAGPNRDNTIVIICGDNGYQFGEKDHWSKARLWEGSAHIPLVICGPGVAKGTSIRPVSLLDLYPTLVEFAGLPAKKDIDGTSLVPLLKNPSAAWERPALTTEGFKNHALRTERWRYIRYSDGSEELYDHDNDPLEHKNVAASPEFAQVKADLQKWLPAHDEPRNPNPKGSGKEE